jgi:hypothetical protein
MYGSAGEECRAVGVCCGITKVIMQGMLYHVAG